MGDERLTMEELEFCLEKLTGQKNFDDI